MGKQGPCGHCGIATTPLWRNGPSEKPVLCNACGSRWRTKGTLLNYMPMHSGGFGGSTNPEGSAVGHGKKISRRTLSEHRSYKRKEPSGGHYQTGPIRPFDKSAAEDSVSESSLSSYMSGSDDEAFCSSSPVQIDSAADSNPPWEGRVPCRKRTSMARACTSVDKLIRQFQDLLYEDSPARSSLTSESVEDVLVDSKPSTMSDEIGLGSIFIRQPMLDEYRSASFIDTPEPKSLDMFPLFSGFRRNGSPLTKLPNGAENFTSVHGIEKEKLVKSFDDVDRIHHKRQSTGNIAFLDDFPRNKWDVLQSCQSPIVCLELKDIINFDTFTGLLTDHEQGQLVQLLSSEDTADATDSLKEMFTSAQFGCSLVNFQELLSESMFEHSAATVKPRVLEHYQQLLTITDLTSSGWIEQCSQLHTRSRRRSGSSDFTKGCRLPRTRSTDVPSNEQFQEITLRSGIYRHNGGINHFSSTGVATENILETENLDNGSSSNDGGFGFETRGSPYDGSGLQACGIGSAQKDDLPNLYSPEIDETEADLLFDNPSSIMSLQDSGFVQQLQWQKSKKDLVENEVENISLVNNIWQMDSNPGELFWNPIPAGPGQVLPNGTILNPGRMII